MHDRAWVQTQIWVLNISCWYGNSLKGRISCVTKKANIEMTTPAFGQYNMIPENLRKTEKLAVFKKKLKKCTYQFS